MSKDLRVNREIKTSMVRVVEDEKQLGIMSLEEALAQAAKAGLDLVEVAPNTEPPVCRIMDYGKFRYRQTKKLHDAKKSQTITQLKEIRLRPKTEEHDLQIKVKHIRKFLDQRDKVKVTMMFRGRELSFAAHGQRIMDEIKERLADSCVIEQSPKLEGRNMVMVLSPKR